MKLSTKNPSRLYSGLIFLFSFAFYAFVMYCSPFSSDDLEYAIHPRTQLAEALEFVLSYGNGRFLGNLGALYLCTNIFLRMIVKALVISAMIALIPLVLGIYTPSSHMLTFILFTGMSGSLFSQVFTWTSGFQNYVPPVFLLLLILCCIRKIERGTSWLSTLLLLASIFIAAIASQLYIEISTVIHCLLALYMLAFAIKHKGASRFAVIVWLIGSLLGAALMFSIPKLFTSPDNWNVTYRSAGADSILSLISNIIVNISKLFSFYSENTLVCCGLCVCAYHALSRRGANDGVWGKRSKAALKVSLLYFGINFFVCRGQWYGAMSVIRNAFTAPFLLIPLIIWIGCIWKDKSRQFKIRQLTLIGFAVMSLLPLMIVNPISMRCIFLSYVFFSASLLHYVCNKVSAPDICTKKAQKWIASAAVILAMCISIMFTNILWLSNTRDRYIEYKMEQGAAEIVIYPIPYDYVFWDGTNIYRFEYYHAEPGDVTFTAIAYKEWSYLYGTELLS